VTKPRVTLKDIAGRVGVHPSTVSRVLNPKTRGMVNPEIAATIAETADKMGYRPNPFAYSLRTRRSFIIGVMIPDIANPVFPPIIRGIERILEPHGYAVVLANTDNSSERERVSIERFVERQVDGLITATSLLSDDFLVDLGADVPVVFVNRRAETPGVPSVVVNDAAGIAAIIEHLVSLGHRRVAHVAGPQLMSTGKIRYETFVEECRKAGLATDATLIEFTDAFMEGEGRRAATALLKREKFTAIVAANDLLALGCYGALADAGLVCGRDVSVTGFNDMPFVDRLQPPLTTVHIPLNEMGEGAARLLLDQLMENGSSETTITLQPELVVRASTGPAPKVAKK